MRNECFLGPCHLLQKLSGYFTMYCFYCFSSFHRTYLQQLGLYVTVQMTRLTIILGLVVWILTSSLTYWSQLLWVFPKLFIKMTAPSKTKQLLPDIQIVFYPSKYKIAQFCTTCFVKISQSYQNPTTSQIPYSYTMTYTLHSTFNYSPSNLFLELDLNHVLDQIMTAHSK